MELCQTECMAQKVRREVEKRTKEEAKRQRVVDEEKKKRKTLKYL